jgi:hypothetical protein
MQIEKKATEQTVKSEPAPKELAMQALKQIRGTGVMGAYQGCDHFRKPPTK